MEPQYMPENTRYINHYNVDDWALAASRWQLNQKSKPDGNYFYGNTILNTTLRFFHQPFLSSRDLDFPVDRYEIFSRAAEARSYATGAEGATGGAFNVLDSINLKIKFGFEEEHKGHSAQFRSFIQKRWKYWEQVLSDLDVVEP